MLLLAARKLRVQPSDCLMVGDSVVDVRAAHAAKMPAVAWHCKTAASSFADLKKEKPARIARSVGDLARFLRNA
jgi:phosphoglycolate phosphatase-like HAD superfamily hydrolase